MRIYLLSLVFAVAAAACGDNENSSVKPDLSMGGGGEDLAGADLSVNGGDDLSMADMAVPTEGIAGVRAAADKAGGKNLDAGVLAMAIPVKDVYVTYIRPEITGETSDPPGFFVQAEQLGPALFVRVNPASLTPAPLVGDLVQFTVTGAGLDGGGVHMATTITDWMVSSSGNALTALVQDLSSATDLTTKIVNYESELSTVTGVVSGTFGSSSASYVQALMTTAGIPGATGNPKLRMPTSLHDALGISTGCHVTVGPTPMWMFNGSAEPSAWVASDIVVSSCPAPQVLSAMATDSTHVTVTFDRPINASTLAADGSQFTFNNSLTVDAGGATQSTPTTVSINTTPQTSATAYTVTAATSLTDTLGTALDAAHTTATFTGFTPPAKLIINEFNVNITGSLDQVELKATTGGSVAGFQLFEDFTAAHNILVATLPSNLVVQTGDYILVHLGVTPSPTPNPSPGPVFTEFNVGNANGSPITECTNATCKPGAWDVGGTAGLGLPYASRRLISIADGTGKVMDAVAYSDETGGSAGFGGSELQAAIDANLWTPACAHTPCGANDTTGAGATDFDGTAFNVKTPALGTSATSATATGNSAQRMNANQPSSAADWHTATQSWGAVNN